MVTRKDIACKCGCGFDSLDYELKIILEDIEYSFDDIIITCGNRCVNHNNSIPGSSSTSLHVKGLAVDIKPETKKVHDLYNYINYAYKGRLELILYNTFVHIGIQDYAERYDVRR